MTLGGLVGNNAAGGEIIASYATGSADGGSAGGLVGRNLGEIIASYATGSANGALLAGWLAGITAALLPPAMPPEVLMALIISSVISARSSANTGSGTITASYGFGALTGDGNRNTHGAPPGGITAATALTATNAGAQWNAAASDTMDAWDFGSATQTPAVRFADYDGTGTDYDCDMFPATLPGGATITCGTTLIPGQGR